MREASQHTGDPEDPAVSYGPLVDKISFNRVTVMIERAKGEAELVVGGNQIGESSCFIKPTVFVNPNPNTEILKAEVFRPVSVVSIFNTEEEIIDKANNSDFGLISSVFIKDITRALRVLSKMELGVVGVNCVSYVSILCGYAQFCYSNNLRLTLRSPLVDSSHRVSDANLAQR